MTFEFDDACKKSFHVLKEKLISTLIIQPLEIICDANNYAVGVVLRQRIGKNPHVIYYASRTLDHDQVHSLQQKKNYLL